MRFPDLTPDWAENAVRGAYNAVTPRTNEPSNSPFGPRQGVGDYFRSQVSQFDPRQPANLLNYLSIFPGPSGKYSVGPLRQAYLDQLNNVKSRRTYPLGQRDNPEAWRTEYPPHMQRQPLETRGFPISPGVAADVPAIRILANKMGVPGMSGDALIELMMNMRGNPMARLGILREEGNFFGARGDKVVTPESARAPFWDDSMPIFGRQTDSPSYAVLRQLLAKSGIQRRN